MRFVSILGTLAVSLLLAANLSAAEKGKPGAGRGPMMGMPGMDMLGRLNLTDDQKAKLKEEYGPKMMEIMKKSQGVLTEEQRQARQEAVKKAMADGKKGQEVMKAAQDAVKLTDEQKKKMAETQKEIQDIMKEATDKILTPEQKDQLQKLQEERKGKKQ
jgi:Spy/CpxP family protein refolding chaperone